MIKTETPSSSQSFPYPIELKSYNLNELCEFFEDNQKLNSLKLFTDLDFLLKNLIQSQINLKTESFSQNTPSNSDRFNEETQSGFYLDPLGLTDNLIDIPSLQPTFTNQLNQIKPIENQLIDQSGAEFIEEFSMENFMDFDLTDALMSAEPLAGLSINKIDQNDNIMTCNEPVNNIELKSSNQIALNSKFDQSILYSSNHPNIPQVITDVKSKNGSGIKIVKMNKNIIDDKSEIIEKKITTDIISLKPKSTDELDSNGDKLLPWEIRTNKKRTL